MYTLDADIKNICVKCFPSYKGRKFQVEAFRSGMSLRSYWNGGSRNFFRFFDLVEGTVFADVPQNGTMFDNASYLISALPQNMVVVKHTIFRGRDLGCTVYANADNMPKALTAGLEDLTEDEKVRLHVTWTYKARYAGLDYRREEAKKLGLTDERYDAATASLIERGLLDKRTALTMAGKNAAKGL